MENNIPLPTDSIYKFYALFGLLLFIFSIGSTIYISRSTNDLVFTSAIEYETLKAIEKPTSVEIAKRVGIEKRVEIAPADKKFFLYSLGVIAGLATFAMIYGFTKRHRDIQPIQDETARLQFEKLKLEVAGLPPHSTESARIAVQACES
jgi:hypothetical protein